MNKRTALLIPLCTLFLLLACNKKISDNTKDDIKENIKTEIDEMTETIPTEVVKHSPAKSVPGDPLGVKIYTLKNGMKLYMSVNKKEPRIQTNIAVRAGSKHDPADATGLAHYLEHMMFKGTSKVGALNWEEESKMLQQISDLYEKHRKETDPEKRKAIYAEIDKVSNDAANLVAPNEYDKMVSSLGTKGTNAYTWVEQTVYVNDIPSNELERWLQLESERFKECVLRLFHTELEAVYEEFNINQDRDFRKSNKAIRETLFPSHPYGTQTTIGEGEHLKNPSHVKIQEYFKKYYVPNNMAIVVAGDFDPKEMIELVEKYFGDYEHQSMDRPKFEKQPQLTKRVQKTVNGQQDPYVDMGWSFGGVGSADPLMLEMIRGIMFNRKAGLLDININQKQKMLEADAWVWAYEDYSVFGLFGKPRKGQSLKEVEDLLMAEIDKLHKGEFQDWMMDAVVKNLKLNEIRGAESNQARVGAMTDAFILDKSWADYVDRFDKMSKITKQQVMDFARAYLRKDNYVVVYKESAEDKDVFKVEKPSITPITLNRDQASEYTQAFMKSESEELSPVFLDYKKEINTKQLKEGLELDYIKNTSNPLFTLHYILEMGKNHDKKLPLAIEYLPYLGTDKYSAEQLQEEFFKLGLSFSVNSGSERVYVTLTGLEESLERGLELFEHYLSNAKGDKAALENVIADILVRRENAKKDKNTIRRSAMGNFARYGKHSAFTDVLSEQQLKAIRPGDLVEKIKDLSSYEHRIFYYGTRTQDEVATLINKYHETPDSFRKIPAGKDYPEVGGTQNEVYFVEFPMVQAEVLMMSKGTERFNAGEYILGELYNTYFGFGLSSIMFQEIRESRALAYSTYAYYGSPSKADKAHYLQAYVGTQANKLKDAIPAVKEILEDMPVADEQIENARQAIIKKIETERINGAAKYWNSRAATERGLDHDLRQDVYKRMQSMTAEDLKRFQAEHVKGRKYVIMVLGSRKNIGDEGMKYLQSLGKVQTLTLEELFGY